MLGICLYRPNSGAGDDEKALRLIRKVEGDEEAAATAGAGGHGRGRPRPWKSLECVRSRYRIWSDRRASLPSSVPELIIWEGVDGYPVPLARPVLRGAVGEDHCQDFYCGFLQVDGNSWEYHGSTGRGSAARSVEFAVSAPVCSIAITGRKWNVSCVIYIL